MAIMNKDRQPHGFTVGQIVYMYNPSGGKLQTGSRKIQCHFVGASSNLQVYKPQPVSTYVTKWSIIPHGCRRSQIKTRLNIHS